MFHGYVKREKKRINELIYLAHSTASLTRAQKIPDLKSLLIQDEVEPKQMSDEAMLAMAKVLNAAFGGSEVEL